jgi:hypothetical protein
LTEVHAFLRASGLCAGISIVLCNNAHAEGISRQVLAFYYGWWGNSQVSGDWRHWRNVDPTNERIENSTDFPAFGAYDSHDPATVDRQVALARNAGITGFIVSWWGQGSFEDHGMPLLLDTAARHGLVVSAYYEKIIGEDAASRKASAIGDFDYLLRQYATHPAWLRLGGKPVLFVFGRALHQLSLGEWQEVIAQVRGDNSKAWHSSQMRSTPNTAPFSTARAPTTSPARHSIKRRRRSASGPMPLTRRWWQPLGRTKSRL